MPNFRCTGLFTVAPFFGSTKKMRGLPWASTLSRADVPKTVATASAARVRWRATLMVSLLLLEMDILRAAQTGKPARRQPSRSGLKRQDTRGRSRGERTVGRQHDRG